MGDVKINGLNRENAVLLLAAAEELGESRALVRSQGDGFLVPEEIAVKAGLAEGNAPDEVKDEAPAKKAPAKRTTTRKTAAKKTATKKSASKE